MDTKLQQLIASTVQASGLYDEEAAELERELKTHIQDAKRDLLFSGVQQEDIPARIIEEFGNPDAIGKQLFTVHRNLERIPWIGPFFYYVPLRGSARLFMGHILSIASVFFAGPFTQRLSIGNPIGEFQYNQFILLICVLFPLSYLWGMYWSVIHLRTWSRIIEAVILSYIPPLLGLGLYWLSTWLHSVPWFSSEIESMDSSSPWWAPFGLCIAAQLFAIGVDLIVVYVIKYYRKRKQ